MLVHIRKARSVAERAGIQTKIPLLAHGAVFVLEAVPSMQRGALGRAPVWHPYHVLQVISELVQGIRIVMQHQRVADFEDTARRVIAVIDERIVDPLANLVRQSGRVLRENAAALVNRGGVAVGLTLYVAAARTVVTTNAAPARGQVHVIGEEYRQSVRCNSQLLEKRL